MRTATVAVISALMLGTGVMSLFPEAMAQPDGTKLSVRSGVYTAAQGQRGAKIHKTTCAPCHGEQLDGAGLPDQPQSPGIAGDILFFKWQGPTLSDLYTYVLTKMPPETPGSLSPQDAVDAVAHILAVSEMPTGDKELPPDPKALAAIVIPGKPKK